METIEYTFKESLFGTLKQTLAISPYSILGQDLPQSTVQNVELQIISAESSKFIFWFIGKLSR